MPVTTKNYAVAIELNPRTKLESILFDGIKTIVTTATTEFKDKVKLQAKIEADIQEAITKHNASIIDETYNPKRKPTRKFHMGHGASHIWVSVLFDKPKTQGELLAEGKSLGEAMQDRAVLITFQNVYE